MQKLNHPPPRKQRGFALLESLIAIVIMALGILGIVGMQMRTLTDTQTSVRRAQAIRLIEDLSERMRVNPNALLSVNNYLSTFATTSDDYTSASNYCLQNSCTATEQASFDLLQWKSAVQQTLPLGQASIFLAPGETNAANRRQLGVIVAWRENERNINDAADNKKYKDNIDASLNLNSDGTFSAGTDADNACPADFTCHLQYLPVPARCAPYGSSSAVYCS